MTGRGKILSAGGLAVVALGAAVAVYAYNEQQPTEKRGSAEDEFVASAKPEKKPPPERELPRPWPTYGYDAARTHISPFGHRPPYRRVWRIDAHDTLEFPPTVGYERITCAQQKGSSSRFARGPGRWTGGRAWDAAPRRRRRSAAAWSTRLTCIRSNACRDRPGRTASSWPGTPKPAGSAGASRPRRSSHRLLRNGRLYFGSWDHRVYAVGAERGRKIWSFEADEVNTSAAYWKRTIFIASDGGTLYALNARNGKLRWSAQSNSTFGSREFFYATPTVAYGRVYIGNTDGTMYVYGARSGRLLWRRPLGSYIYGAAAVHKRRVFVGTYDGKFYALDAATGDTLWQIDAPGRCTRRRPSWLTSRLLRDLRHLRLGGPALRQSTAPTFRRAGTRRQAGVELRGGQVRQSRGLGPKADLHHGSRPPVRARAANGAAQAMSTAAQAPVSGHTR